MAAPVVAPVVAPVFAILAYDGIEPIDIGATYGVLSMARRIVPGIGFFVVSRSGGEVTMAQGLRLVAGHGFAARPPAGGDSAPFIGIVGGAQLVHDPQPFEGVLPVVEPSGVDLTEVALDDACHHILIGIAIVVMVRLHRRLCRRVNRYGSLNSCFEIGSQSQHLLNLIVAAELLG